ncbi:MAG: hypothetical protein IKK21_03040 [Clostridia bacterium]|nr:hypothetical protein [Clostridia bacterium]
MKKLLALTLSLLLCCALAQAEEITVNVSVTGGDGALALALTPVTVTDADGDGALTISDALYAAHAAHHPDGAAAYSAVPSEFGLSMLKLWGVENGGSYGYYVNHVSPMSLLDPVHAGDHVKAYAYTDLTAWSDLYCFFAADTVTAKVGEAVSLTLSAAGYDASWMPVTLPVAGAVITVDGEKTEIVTDENGCASLTLAEAGEYLISAVSDTQTLVAPVCIVKVEE